MLELHWPIVDDQVVASQFNGFLSFAQIGFDVHHVIAVSGNPYSALEWYRENAPIIFPGSNLRRYAGALLEAHLPGGLTPPLSQPFAGVRQVGFILGFENVHAKPD